MKTPSPDRQPWPPIIDSRHVPLYVRIRDVILTLLAWLVITMLLWELIYLLWDFLSHPIFSLTGSHELNWRSLWDQISIFAVGALSLILALVIIAVARGKDLMYKKKVTPVAALTLQEQAADLGLSPEAILEWRQHQIVTVHFDRTDKIKSVKKGGLKGKEK